MTRRATTADAGADRRRTWDAAPPGDDPRHREAAGSAPPGTRAIRAAARDAQHGYLVVAFPVLAGFYAVLAASHVAMLEPPVRGWMAGLAAVSSATCAAASAAVRTDWGRRRVPALTLLFVAIVCGNSGAHLVATAEPHQATNLLLAAVGAGVLLFEPLPLALALGSCAAAFALAVARAPGAPLWVHFGFGLFSSAILAVVVFAARRSELAARVTAERARDEALAALRRQLDALRRSEASHRALVRYSPAAMFVHRDGEVLYANLAAGRLLAAGDDAVLIGTRFYDLFDPDHQEQVAAWAARALDGSLGDVTLTARLRALHGPWPTVHLAGARIRWEGEPAALLVATLPHDAAG